MASERSKNDYTLEMRDFAGWAYWVERSDAKTIFHICGLSSHGSPPNPMARAFQLGKPGGPTVYIQESSAPPPQALLVQAFMDEFMISHREYHQALVAKHLRRVNGELMLYSSESRIAEMLYTGLTRVSAQSKLSKYCIRGYGYYRGWLLAQEAA